MAWLSEEAEHLFFENLTVRRRLQNALLRLVRRFVSPSRASLAAEG